MHFKLNIRRYSPISHFHKIVNIMRLSLVLCMLTIFCASATVSYSQVNEISLHLEDATLEQALEAIKQQSEYSFWYRNDEINLGRKVSVNINNQNIANVLDRLLATQGLAYTINEKHIVIYKTNEKASHPMITNNKKITGKVTDEKNEPIIGANVVVKGSTTGTITDMDGNFTLEVPDQATLLVSYIGYTPKEVAVKNQNNLSIMMIEDSKTIDEVVVIGYGSVKKSNLTGAVSSVKTTEIQQTPMTSIDQGLVGRASGVQVTQTSGMPGAEWEFLKDLKLKVSLGMDIMYLKQNKYTPSNIYQSLGIASAKVGVNRSINWLNENILTWNKTFKDIHSLNILGGFTIQRNNVESVTGASSNFVNDVMKYNNLGAGSIYDKPESSATQWSLMSYLARINYSLYDRYLFSVNGRVDGSSRFGGNNKYGFFPSGSVAWRISEEGFMEPVKAVINNLKLHTSYGFTGNTEIGVYESLATLGSNSWTIGNQLVSGFYPNRIPNPDLKWEKTGQFDIGFDLGLFNNRLRLTADYYYKKTTDLLYNVAIPSASGYDSMLKNIGSVQNKGYELSIESDNLSGAFSWTTAFNISFNRNKVLELGGETYKDVGTYDDHLKTSDIRRLIVGQPIGVFYGYRFDGIFQNEAECAQQTSSPSPIGVGLRRYKDLNGDGKIDATNDREILGDANPKFFGGMTNTFAYKGFELNVFLQYSYGNKIFNYNAMELESPTGGQNVYQDLVNRWTPTNPSNEYQKATTNRNNIVSDRFIEDGSFLKLKTVSLSYSFPKLNWKHIGGLRLYVTGQNLLTWTKYRGYDPEVSYRGASTLEAGEDFGGYPQARTFMFGIKLDIK